MDPAHPLQLPCRGNYTSEEGSIGSLIFWQGAKERGLKNEDEEEEISDGKSTASLLQACKVSHLLAISVVASEDCSEVAQVPPCIPRPWGSADSTHLHRALLFAIQSKMIQPPCCLFFLPLLVVFGTSQGLLTLHFAFSQGLCCLGQVAVMNVHTGMIIASLYTFLTVIYPRGKQYWVRLCNIQLGNKPKQKSQEKKTSLYCVLVHPSQLEELVKTWVVVKEVLPLRHMICTNESVASLLHVRHQTKLVMSESPRKPPPKLEKERHYFVWKSSSKQKGLNPTFQRWKWTGEGNGVLRAVPFLYWFCSGRRMALAKPLAPLSWQITFHIPFQPDLRSLLKQTSKLQIDGVSHPQSLFLGADLLFAIWRGSGSSYQFLLTLILLCELKGRGGTDSPLQ